MPVATAKYVVNARSIIMLHYDYAIETQAATHHPSET
jgi:hypothetical protein